MEALTQDEFLAGIDGALSRLEAHEDLNIFIHANPEEIRQSARAYAETLTGQSDGALSGNIIAIKDNLNVRGMPTTCASHILDRFEAPYNATAIQNILDAGGFIFGKTNLDEFAMGSSNEYSCFGITRNPVDSGRVPGGSSGGSAAAVRAEIVDMALGSETGGSVRQPAAFCGIVGLKPTYGRVSRYGLVAFASSFDQIAPLGRSVEDVAQLLQVIAGYDPRDSTSVDIAVPEYLDTPMQSAEEWTLGLPAQYFAEGLDPEIEENIQSVVEWLENQGATIVDLNLPHADYAIATYYILATAEASSNLARYDGMRYGLRERKESLGDTYRQTRSTGFGEEVKRRIMLGTYVLSSGYYEAYYSKAQKVRRLIKSDFDTAFKQVDALILPTTPSTAFEIGSKLDDPLQMYLSDIYTVPANLAGLPALSIPVGNDSQGLPIGLQIMAKPFAEETILQLGHYIEQQWSQTTNSTT